VTPDRDAASTFRAVSQLRRLCLSLPHLPTPTEERLLTRFAALVAAPSLATGEDADALTAGWRQWWRAGRSGDIARMARQLPGCLVNSDRQLVTLATAASWRAS
jgi:hypothetical protein